MQSKQQEQLLGIRLSTAIPYITPGSCVADIGTDHAYLPIHLVKNGLCACAVACDINEGPLQSARTNIAEAGLCDRIDTLLTDGLHGVERFSPQDVIIFGMGGELIVRILSEATWTRNVRVGLILQPMSRAEILRKWLVGNGFSIEGETISFEGKYYQTIHARYTGAEDSYTAIECRVGRRNIQDRPALFEGFVRHEIKVLDNILAGKAQARATDTTDERSLRSALEALL